MQDLQIWTDGGKRKKYCSWAFCLYSEQLDKIIYQHSGHKQGTSQEGELTACCEALKFIENCFKQNLDRINITLYSDSQYLVHGMNKWVINWKNRSWKGSSGDTIKNLTYWQELYRHKKSIPHITFKWVRGHIGIELNEHVDKLCQEELQKVKNVE